jgi:hypothetical protein
MKARKLIFIILIFGFMNIYGQADSAYLKKRHECTSPMFYANNLATHPFGIFISRVNNNFKIRAEKKASLKLNISSGNVWLPYVKGYVPLNNEDQAFMSQFMWHDRETHFDPEKMPHETLGFTADGIFRLYSFSLTVPVTSNQEVMVRFRSFSIDNMHFPYLTTDNFIEWFHDNVSGDGDLFGRKEYGFDHVYYSYTDKNGRSINLPKGQMIFSGIELSYFYYPKIEFLNKNNFYLNAGVQAGMNVSEINPSADLGINSTITKRFAFKKRDLFLAFSGGILRQHIVSFSDQRVELGERDFLYTGEIMLTYRRHINNNVCIDFATSYYVQSAYNIPHEFDYIVLTGKRRNHWNHALLDLYHPITDNTFSLTVTSKKFAISLYIREDFKVDNAPDIQIGSAVKFYFNK